MPSALLGALLLTVAELVAVIKVNALGSLKHVVKLLLKHCQGLAGGDDDDVEGAQRGGLVPNELTRSLLTHLLTHSLTLALTSE